MLTQAPRWRKWHQQVEAKLRDVADWRLWHNTGDGPVVNVDARDTRQKWVLTSHAPPMHRTGTGLALCMTRCLPIALP